MLHHIAAWSLAVSPWHAPLLALLVALAARLLGHTAGKARLRGTEAAFGLLAGWVLLTTPALHDLTLHAVLAPTSEAGRLPIAALMILAASALMPAAGKPGRTIPLLLGALTGWWLAGAPAHGDALVRGMAAAAVCALATLWSLRLLADGDAWRSTAAAIALSAALLAAGAPEHWVEAALVATGAVAALLPAQAAGMMLASAAGLTSTAVAAELADGMAAHRTPGPTDLACLTPLAVLLVAPRLLPRLTRAGPALAGILAGATCVVLVWAIGHATGHR